MGLSLRGILCLSVLALSCGRVEPLGALCSSDSDRDGVCDEVDACPGFDDALDADNDGIPNACDACAEGHDAIDHDGDGIPNGCDRCRGFDDAIDGDQDGVPDACDVCSGDDHFDADRDGTPDACDLCPDFDDRKDRDHDGTPDGCDTCAAGAYDIALLIDTSGSMLPEMQSLLDSLILYVDSLQGNDVRFAVVDLALEQAPHVGMALDFGPLQEISEDLKDIEASGGYLEASLDGLYLTCLSRSLRTVPLSWRESSTPVIFGFTDEPPQSYLTPAVDGYDVKMACTENDVAVYQWSANLPLFQPICWPTGGSAEPLSQNLDSMLGSLNEVALELCD